MPNLQKIYFHLKIPACDPTPPQTCQVGDLSRKHEKITSDPLVASYSDEFASTVEGLDWFFGNRSLTAHFANATRITCANFTLLGNSVGGGDGQENTTATTPTASAGPAQFTGLGIALSPVGSTMYLLIVAALALVL